MDITAPLPGQTDAEPTARTPARAALVSFLVAAVQLLIPAGDAPTASAADTSPSCCEAAGGGDVGTVTPPAPVASAFDEDRLVPDATADHPGGIAARLYTGDGDRVPGDIFLLMAAPGSTAPARLFDETPYRHDNGTATDARESNVAAVEIVEEVTGLDVEQLELTTAPAGGPSGGITYTIAYLDVVSDGAFTGGLRVAATGEIGRDGYVEPIDNIDEKTAAAHLADADVLFTPSTPDAEHTATHATRFVGELFRIRHSGNPLAEERMLDHYHEWGADRPDGMDIVGVRHIADVAAYLCGAGSEYACDFTDLVEDTTTEFPDDVSRPDGADAAARRPLDHGASTARLSGQQAR